MTKELVPANRLEPPGKGMDSGCRQAACTLNILEATPSLQGLQLLGIIPRLGRSAGDLIQL